MRPTRSETSIDRYDPAAAHQRRNPRRTHGSRPPDRRSRPPERSRPRAARQARRRRGPQATRRRHDRRRRRRGARRSRPRLDRRASRGARARSTSPSPPARTTRRCPTGCRNGCCLYTAARSAAITACGVREWWRHDEAVARLDALWRAWEHLRLDPATGLSVWFRDHADHHMSILLDADGPLKGCDATHSQRPLDPLPYDPPPPGTFEPDDDLIPSAPVDAPGVAHSHSHAAGRDTKTGRAL